MTVSELLPCFCSMWIEQNDTPNLHFVYCPAYYRERVAEQIAILKADRDIQLVNAGEVERALMEQIANLKYRTDIAAAKAAEHERAAVEAMRERCAVAADNQCQYSTRLCDVKYEERCKACEIAAAIRRMELK